MICILAKFMKQKLLNQKRIRRVKRTRAKILGTAKRPQLSIFRSNRYIYAQLIDDENGKTLISASSFSIQKEKKSKANTVELLGELIAKEALKKGIKEAVFDRGKYKYHGKIKAVAEAARKNGLKI